MTVRTALVLDGSSGPALATTRSLGRAGWRVLVGGGVRAARSRYAAAAVEILPADARPDEFLEAVAATVARAGVDVVVPATDISVDLLRANGAALGAAQLLGADGSSYARVGDKASALAAADELGFGTPAWVRPASVEEARSELARIGLPCVVKASRSYVRSGDGFRHRRHSFVRAEHELEAALADQAEPDGSLPVLEAFVPGRSLSASMVIRDGRVLGLVAREALSFDPVAGGNSVWKRTVPPDDVGVRAAVEFLLAVGYEGLAEVEYQAVAGREHLMEVGVRPHGWFPLAIAAGVDLPLIAACALLGDELPERRDYRVGVEMRWPAGELRRLRTALDPRSSLPPGVSRASVLAKAWPPWRPGMHYDGLTLDDRGPWLPWTRPRAPATRGDVNSVPSTNRDNGPNRPSAA
jgi:biotin carboxylase